MNKALFVLLVSCGAPAKGPAPARQDSWQPLSFEERHSVITFTVLPNMARTWRDFKKTRYPEMTCRTCHGTDAERVGYRMPNPALPRVDPAHPPEGPVATFMRDTIVPQMIDLEGTTSNRFGCNSCHPR